MISNALLIIIAIIGGIAITLQGQFMGMMDQGIGTKESVFITYASGGVIISLFLLANHGGNLRAWHSVPWYSLSAGLLGLLIVGTIGFVVPRLGLAPGFTLIVASQFVVAALIDHFGLLGAAVRPIDLSRALGLAVLLVGVWLIMR
jgi:transporter family-2 protein